MNNQEAKRDAGKLDPTLVPTQLIWDVAEIRAYGNDKYGSSDNWKDVEIERYRAALYRHLLAYLDDPKGKDAESGKEHYKHMACNIAFICALEAEEVKPKERESTAGLQQITELLACAEW